MTNNAEWLYEQCRRDDAADEGVHLTFAHAMQIAGELCKLDKYRAAIDGSIVCLQAVIEGQERLDPVATVLLRVQHHLEESLK